MQNTVRVLPHAFFLAWRRILTSAVQTMLHAWARLRRAGARQVDGWILVGKYLTDTRSAWAHGDLDHITVPASFGLRAFVAGLLIATGIMLGAGSRLPTVGLSALTELLWAAARVTIILLVLPTDVRRSRALLAFAAGLIPYAIGITPLLRFASLWLSALLTARGLRGAGASPRTVRTSTGWAFGGQAATEIAGVVGRSVIATLSGL